MSLFPYSPLHLCLSALVSVCPCVWAYALPCYALSPHPNHLLLLSYSSSALLLCPSVIDIKLSAPKRAPDTASASPCSC